MLDQIEETRQGVGSEAPPQRGQGPTHRGFAGTPGGSEVAFLCRSEQVRDLSLGLY